MKTRKSELLGKQVMLEGLMAFGKLENGQRTLDFECYFVFTLDDDRIDELPYLLTRQSGIIANKVLRKILFDKEVMQ